MMKNKNKQKIAKLARKLKTYNKSTKIIPEKLFNELATIKKSVVEKDDQKTAKLTWCLEQVGQIHNSFCNAFREMKNGEFMSAWRSFEHCENRIHSLRPHFEKAFSKYNLCFIDTYVEKWQSLFPYKYFLSPGFIKRIKRCSVCGKEISIRNHCGHIPGEIYNGEICSRQIEKAEVLEISIVTNPVQKFSVLLFQDPETGQTKDDYDYKLVGYSVDCLESPFHGWSVAKIIKIRHHSLFKHIKPEKPCPCGSKDNYEECCLKKDGVEYPHFQFSFEHEPINGVKEIIYT